MPYSFAKMIEVFFSIFNITTSCSGLVDSKGQSLDDEYMEDNYGAPLNMVRYIYYHHHFLTINIIITIILHHHHYHHHHIEEDKDTRSSLQSTLSEKNQIAKLSSFQPYFPTNEQEIRQCIK